MGKKDKQKSTYTLDDALFDVEARFLLPMSLDDIERSDRLFFQIEQAHWFYEVNHYYSVIYYYIILVGFYCGGA